MSVSARTLGVLDRAADVRSEAVGEGQLEADGLGRDDVHQRSALEAGEDVAVDRLRERALDRREVGRIDLRRQLEATEDHAAAGPAQGLVGRRRHDVGVGEGARVQAGGDEAGDVRHVDHEQGTDLVGDGCHALELDDPRVGARRRPR